MILQQLWKCMVTTSDKRFIVEMLVDNRNAFELEVRRRYPDGEIGFIHRVDDRDAINEAVRKQRKQRERLGT